MKTFTISLTGLVCAVLCATTLALAQSPTPLAANGRLKLVGRQLSSESGSAIQLRGMSSHGLQWFDQCYTQASVQALARDWGIDVFRAAMYVDEGGYLNNQAGLRAKIDQLVDWTAQAGIYCIIDWHVLNPGNPNDRLSYALDFFRTMAQKHAGKKNVIYEICNEPNGVDWNTIKAYADQVIPIIRQYDSQAIILCGTPQWDQRPQDVLANPLTGANAYNVMYTFHYYAASHFFQSDVRSVVNSLPLFCSEWGTTTYTGNGGYDFNNAQAWLDLMAGQNPAGQKISWCNWSFSQAPENSAALNQGACDSQSWNNTSTSGTWVKNKILNPADSWAGGTTPPPTNQAPTVTLTSPANNAQFTAPASVGLTASAADADGSVSKVEFFSGATKLGERLSAPYAFTWTSVGAGSYALTAKATDNKGATTTSAVVNIQVNSATPTPPPVNTSGDIIGPDCVRINDVKAFELNARNLPNATGFSWWVNGSTQSITPTSAGKVSVNFGPYFTGGSVCVGVNYSAVPWYAQYCKNVTVCAPGARAGSADDIADGPVFPNPTADRFLFVADRDVQSMSVVDQQGRERLHVGAARAGQTVSFGEQLTAGTYLLRIQYETKHRRVVKLLKTGN